MDDDGRYGGVMDDKTVIRESSVIFRRYDGDSESDAIFRRAHKDVFDIPQRRR